MNTNKTKGTGRTRHAIALATLAACGMALAGGAMATPKHETIIKAFEDARFVPMDPKRPQGPQIAVLWGDPGIGPSAMLMKFGKGAGAMHVHTADYHLVVLQGTMKHWVKGQHDADAQPLGPGSYWFQPGNEPHADTCLSDECVMFVNWSGKRDAALAL